MYSNSRYKIIHKYSVNILSSFTVDTVFCQVNIYVACYDIGIHVFLFRQFTKIVSNICMNSAISCLESLYSIHNTFRITIYYLNPNIFPFVGFEWCKRDRKQRTPLVRVITRVCATLGSICQRAIDSERKKH